MANILVVDDSNVDRMLFKSYAERIAGYTIIEAEDGIEALSKIDEWNIDLIISDLQMPNMDGLELVKAVRDKYPELPIILATGQGSEKIATEALEAGATGYIPKSQIKESLVPTIRNALAILNSQRSYARLIDCSSELNFKFDIENDHSHFPPLVDLCEKMLSGISPLDRIQRLRIGIAVEQALRNALYRGNLEIDATVRVPFGDEGPSQELFDLMERRLNDPEFKNRRILVNIFINHDRFLCEITDGGAGFQHQVLGDMQSESTGRGLVLMNTFMDEIRFNQKGNHVSMLRTWNVNGDTTDYYEIPVDNSAEEEKHKKAESLGELISLNSGRSIPLLRKKLVIGRGAECHLRIKSEKISDHHCLLTVDNEKWTMQSLDDSHLVQVNGKDATSASLASGDVLHLADHDYEIRYNAALLK